MTPTLTGPIFILLGLLALLKGPTWLSWLVVFFAPFSATAVFNFTGLGFKSGGVGLTPAALFMGLFLLSLVLKGRLFQKHDVSRGHLLQLMLLAAFAVECILSLMFNAASSGVTSFQVTQIIYLLFGLVTTVVLSFEFSRDGALESALTAARLSALFVSLWGLLQFFCFQFGVTYPAILFNNSQSDFADMFDQTSDGFSRIASVAVEPSFFAAAMLHFCAFGLTMLAYDRRLRTAKWLWPVGITLIALVISTSTTAYIGLVVVCLLIFAERPKTMLAYGAPALIVIVAALALIPALRDPILLMTVNKGTTSSYADRVESMAMAFKFFLESPVFGWGWAAKPNMNAITTLLANVGLVGTVLALGAGVATLSELWFGRKGLTHGPDYKLAAYAAGAQNALIVSFVCAVTSGIKYVVLDDACYLAIAIALTTRMAMAQRARAAASRPVVASEQFGVSLVRQ